MKSVYARIEPFTAKDGSLIRELMHPHAHGNKKQSLAEATVAPGHVTRLHRHHCSEEIYHILRGFGRMTLGESRFEVAAGDSVCIAPGTPHCIEALGNTPLTLLCMCSPAYSDDDTELL